MPIPWSVEPTPLPPRELRLTEPDDAHEASYFAASARISSLSRTSSCAISSPYVPKQGGASPAKPDLRSSPPPFVLSERGEPRVAGGSVRCGDALSRPQPYSRT